MEGLFAIKTDNDTNENGCLIRSTIERIFMRGKILNHYYDEIIGMTHLVKENKWGRATADIIAHTDDLDVANQYDGGYLAELRCDTKLQKKKIKALKERLKGMKEMYNAVDEALGYSNRLEHFDDYDSNNPIANPKSCRYDAMRQMNHQISAMEKRIQVEKQKYQNMQDMYPIVADRLVDERRKVRNGKKDKDC